MTSPYFEKTIVVVGAGRTGQALCRHFLRRGARVVLSDRRSPEQLEAVGIKWEPGVTLNLGGHDPAHFLGADLVVLSPGVPSELPVLAAARERGVTVIGEIEVAFGELRAPLVAITGTNGKSTTTTVAGDIFRAWGKRTFVGGNLGTPLIEAVEHSDWDYLVAELSSFQLETIRSFRPSYGMLLNLTADHLDRHGTLEAYAAIKERLVAGADVAVVAVEDRWCQAVADRLALAGKAVVRVSTRRQSVDGVYADAGGLFVTENGAARRVATLDGIGSLRGRHNAENAAAAVAVGRALGLGSAALAAGLKTFPGLAHRMEEVGHRGRVLFVNDSKATNEDAAAKALASFERVYWIAGGRAKEGGIAGLAEYFPRIAKAYLIGEAADDFAASLGSAVAHEGSRRLAAAAEAAAGEAARDPAGEPVVLLSPACASYDQFQSFERRGDVFRQLVAALDGIETRGEAA
jgi:UDP-N-acetylmuramoylalanine--D-glutamate ligase